MREETTMATIANVLSKIQSNRSLRLALLKGPAQRRTALRVAFKGLKPKQLRQLVNFPWRKAATVWRVFMSSMGTGGIT